jgi:hypothetical protein
MLYTPVIGQSVLFDLALSLTGDSRVLLDEINLASAERSNTSQVSSNALGQPLHSPNRASWSPFPVILISASLRVGIQQLMLEIWNREIADGLDHTPHSSIRTLTRALKFAADMASAYGLRRALWEGCLMAFTIILNPSIKMVVGIAQQYLMAGVRSPHSLLSREPSAPRSQPVDNFVNFGHFYLAKSALPEDWWKTTLLPVFERKLLAQIMVTRRYPVLIEAPRPVGKPVP